jgi:hypothetical protein
MNMAKDTTPPKPQTPWEKFTEAARNAFNLSPEQVKKVITATPPHKRNAKRKKRRQPTRK